MTFFTMSFSKNPILRRWAITSCLCVLEGSSKLKTIPLVSLIPSLSGAGRNVGTDMVASMEYTTSNRYGIGDEPDFIISWKRKPSNLLQRSAILFSDGRSSSAISFKYLVWQSCVTLAKTKRSSIMNKREICRSAWTGCWSAEWKKEHKKKDD